MSKPAVLSIAGHDPTGGAGIQADVEAIGAQGVQAFTLITALTVQDTRNVRCLQAVPPDWLAQQASCLFDDCQVSAIKLGLLGEVGQIPLIATWLRQLRVPVVLDPILRAGGGAELLGSALAAGMQAELFPLATVLVPNAAEARRLTGRQQLLDAGLQLLDSGADSVLVTGGDEASAEVENLWFQDGRLTRRFVWPRIAGGFHGAGCTLASALAARLALGEPLEAALTEAQAYTHRSLLRANHPGRGRGIPGRWPGREVAS